MKITNDGGSSIKLSDSPVEIPKDGNIRFIEFINGSRIEFVESEESGRGSGQHRCFQK